MLAGYQKFLYATTRHQLTESAAKYLGGHTDARAAPAALQEQFAGFGPPRRLTCRLLSFPAAVGLALQNRKRCGLQTTIPPTNSSGLSGNSKDDLRHCVISCLRFICHTCHRFSILEMSWARGCSFLGILRVLRLSKSDVYTLWTCYLKILLPATHRFNFLVVIAQSPRRAWAGRKHRWLEPAQTPTTEIFV